MTEKQENILEAALELFAKEGFKGTSTSKIAKRAGVSEGLIFRHFKNKEGLLEAILKQGEEKIKVAFADIVLESDPKKVILKTLLISEVMLAKPEELEFWKLQYKIKWELEQYGAHKVEPLEIALTNAFDKLGYKEPKLEARFLLLNLDGIATRYFLQDDFNYYEMQSFVKAKYNL